MDKRERNSIPAMWWWLSLGIILILAATLYYPNFDFSLPYIDHPDEPQFGLSAQAINDLGTSRSLGYHGYPPGTVSITYVLYKFVHDGDGLPHEILGISRLISITAGVLLIIPLALLAYHAFGEMAGIIAAFLWVMNPTIVAQVRLAVPNNYLTLFSLTALLLAFLGTRYNRSGWATVGLYALMIAIAFKTQAIFLLPLVIGLPLIRLITEAPSAHRPVLQSFGLNIIRISAFLIWLLIFYPTLAANDIPHWVAPTDDLGIPDLATLSYHLQIVLNALVTIIPPVILAAILLIASFWNRFRQQMNYIATGLIGLSVIAWWIGISLFNIQDIRQFYTMMALLTIFHAGAITVFYLLLKEGVTALAARWQLTSVQISRVAGGIVLSIVLLTTLPQLQDNINHIDSLGGVDTRVLLASYADESVAPAPHIATWENHKTFNPSWGGIPMQNYFPLVEQASLERRSIEEWRERGVQYAIMPISSWQDIQEQYSNQVTVLNQFEPTDQQRGPSMVFLYLHPVQNEPLSEYTSLGNIDLHGFDDSITVDDAGTTLNLRLYWQAGSATEFPHQVFVHMLDSDGTIIAQVDTIPLISNTRNTTTWTNEDEILMSRIFSLPLPDNLDPDETYSVITGFYRADTFTRLSNSVTNDDHVVLMTYSPDN